jgi:hypothetical protein
MATWLMVLLCFVLLLTALKGAQVWWLLRDLPAFSVADVRIVLRGNPLDALRARQALQDAGTALPEETVFRERYGVYTLAGNDIALLLAAYRHDDVALQWLRSADTQPRLVITLLAPPYGQGKPLTAWLSAGVAGRWPVAVSAPAAKTGCVYESIGEGKTIAGSCSPDESVRAESLAQTQLPMLANAVRSPLLLHRVNTTYRRDHYAALFPGVEMDVVWNGHEFEVNHPPMRPTGLPLARLMSAMPPGFLWLDWKNAAPDHFLAALPALRRQVGNREHLVELPLAFFRQGGVIPPATGLRYSVYVPTKTAQKLGAAPGALAAEINTLLVNNPDLDCSFDASLLPWMKAHTQCGSRHGIYSWHLQALDSVAAYRTMQARVAGLQALAAQRAGGNLRVIVKLNSRNF